MTAPRPLSILLAAAVLVGAGPPRKVPEDPCTGVNHVPLSMDPLWKLKVLDDRLCFSPVAHGTLSLRNETGKALYGVALVVDYGDARGGHIFTIAYEAGTKDRKLPHLGMPPFYRGILTRPVRPGEVFELKGTNLLGATTIPVSARSYVVSLHFAGEGIFQAAMGAADLLPTDPILYRGPAAFPQLGPAQDGLPPDTLLKLKIGADGVVQDLNFQSGAGAADPFAVRAANELKRWLFIPATREGYAVPSQLPVLLHFHRADFPFARECFIGQGDKYPEILAVVTVVNVPDLPGRWQFFYGGYGTWASPHGEFLGQYTNEVRPGPLGMWSIPPCP